MANLGLLFLFKHVDARLSPTIVTGSISHSYNLLLTRNDKNYSAFAGFKPSPFASEARVPSIMPSPLGSILASPKAHFFHSIFFHREVMGLILATIILRA